MRKVREEILSRLVHASYPIGDTAGIRHSAPPDEARADVTAWLDSVDSDSRRSVSLL